MKALSILCVTRAEPFAWPFLEQMASLATQLEADFVVAADGADAYSHLTDSDLGDLVIHVESKGYIESVLEGAVKSCKSDYILRLDDDETCSYAMLRWLVNGSYLTADHWKFPRMHLWPNRQSVVMTPHLFPDHQTRLSVKHKSGGRTTVHAGSPFGGGELAPVAIEHHKFLVRSYEERLEIASRYDAYHPGYGTGSMRPFSLPEDVYDVVEVVSKGTGQVPWDPEWTRQIAFERG